MRQSNQVGDLPAPLQVFAGRTNAEGRLTVHHRREGEMTLRFFRIPINGGT